MTNLKDKVQVSDEIIEAAIERLEEVVNNYRYEFVSDFEADDAGIGSYEYWGTNYYDSRPYLRCVNEIKFDTRLFTEEEFEILKNSNSLNDILDDVLKSKITGEDPEFENYEYYKMKNNISGIYLNYTST